MQFGQIYGKDMNVQTLRRHIQEFDGYNFFCCVAIALLPFALLAINENWIFSRPFGIDRWIYSGLHLHLPLFLKIYGDTYYTSRLPWTVMGWILHSTFDDFTALCILHFTVFYLGIFSLYAAVRTVFANTTAAFIGALILGTETHFLFAIGWDYVDGVALTWILASIAALTAAAIQPWWRRSAFLWGVCSCATVSIYILLVLLVPVLIGMFVLLNSTRMKRPILAVALWFGTGAVVAMVLFGLVNWFLGGPFLYILNQITELPAVARNRFSYYEPFGSWAASANWLLVTAIAFGFSCVYVAINFRAAVKNIKSSDRIARSEGALFICCLANIFAAIIFGGLQLDHFYVLQMDYNASALLPFAYLTIAGALATIIRPSGRAQQFGFSAASVVIVLAPWVLATFGYLVPKRDLFNGLELEFAWCFAGILLFLLVVQWRKRTVVGPILLILFLAIFNLETGSANIDFPPDAAFKPQTLSVFEASRAVASYNDDGRARFWFSTTDPQQQLLRDVVSSYLWGFCLVNDQFPKIAAPGADNQDTIAPGDRIVILSSSGDDALSLANAAVSDQNLSFELVARLEIRRPTVAFTILITDVRIASDAEAGARVMSPVAMAFATNDGSLQLSPEGVSFHSIAEAWAPVGRMPLLVDCIEGGGWVIADIHVINGTLDAGIMDRQGEEFLMRKTVPPTSDFETIAIRVNSFAVAGQFAVRNWATNLSTQGMIRTVRIIADRGPTPAACNRAP